MNFLNKPLENGQHKNCKYMASAGCTLCAIWAMSLHIILTPPPHHHHQSKMSPACIIWTVYSVQAVATSVMLA